MEWTDRRGALVDGAQERAVASAARALKEVQALERREREGEHEATTTALNRALSALDKSTATRVAEVRSLAQMAQDGVKQLEARAGPVNFTRENTQVHYVVDLRAIYVVCIPRASST